MATEHEPNQTELPTGETGGLGESIKDIFETQPQPEPVQPKPAQPEPAQPESVPPEPEAPPLEELELEVMEAESPAVSERVEVAQDEPEVLPEDTLPVQFDMGFGESQLSTGQPSPEQPSPEQPSSEPPLSGQPPEPQSAEHPAASVAPVTVPEPGIVPEPVAPSAVLEEVTYAPTVTSQGHQPGDEVAGYRLNEALGRGWFSANPVGSGPSVDVYTRPHPLWAGVMPHKLLPKWQAVGDLTVLEPVQGHPLALPLAADTARTYLTELARLLFALEKQSYAVTDLDPDAVQLTAEGLRLRLPPRVARIDEAAEPALRDGFTPPEVQEGQPADARSGVYLLGAVLYRWLTGQTLPPEGPSPVLLAGVNASGMPQLLSEMLAPLPIRLTPTALLDMLKTYSARLPVYQVAAKTDIGLNPERTANEDSYGFVWRQIGQHGGGELVLRAVVSDGMGGMAAGEVASQAAVRGFLDSAAPTLDAQVWDANAAVLRDMAGRDGGCTISAVEIRGEQLWLGHVGDTRAYFAHAGQVQQISKDHSYVAAMVASGQMTPEEAQVSPERNKVLRSLGSLRVPQDNYVQTLPEALTLPVGSRVLLVSDGVWGEVDPAVLHDILLHEKTGQDIVNRLIDLSLKAGAPDNVTALVVERVE